MHLTWPFIVQMFYFDVDLLIERAEQGEATFTRDYPQFT